MIASPIVMIVTPIAKKNTVTRSYIFAESDTGGRDAHLCSDAHHVAVQTATGTVRVHRTCSQPATGCGLLRPEFATTAL